MPHIARRLALKASALTAICFLALNAAGAGEAIVTPVKLGFGAMTEAQKKELWEDVEMYADFDAFLTDCGKPSNIEQRMMAAVQSCVEPGALQKVVAVFRTKKARKSKGFIPGFTSDYCAQPSTAALMKKLRAAIDSAIQRAASACRACVIC